MPFAAGDRVHVEGLGTGEVREVRNRGRYGVLIGVRLVIVAEEDMAAADPPRRRPHPKAESPGNAAPDDSPPAAMPTLDLHGHTVEEAIRALDGFLDAALLAGAAEARVIHGRSGGKVKAAVHGRLRAIGAVRTFQVDPRNAGVTLIAF